MNTNDTTAKQANELDCLATAAKDAAYVAVGFAVLAFQKTQVRRRELTEQLEGPVRDGRKHLHAALEAFGTSAATLDRQAQRFESLIDGAVTEALAHLPAPADAVAARIHETVVAARAHVRQFVLAA